MKTLCGEAAGHATRAKVRNTAVSGSTCLEAVPEHIPGQFPADEHEPALAFFGRFPRTLPAAFDQHAVRSPCDDETSLSSPSMAMMPFIRRMSVPRLAVMFSIQGMNLSGLSGRSAVSDRLPMLSSMRAVRALR